MMPWLATNWWRIALSLVVAAGGVMAAVAWSDARGDAIYAREDFVTAQRMIRESPGTTPAAAAQVRAKLQQLDREFSARETALSQRAWFGVLGVAVALIVLRLLWIRRASVSSGRESEVANEPVAGQ